MHANNEKPDPPIFSYKFQGIFNATVISELAHHTETKMIILQLDHCKTGNITF